ncbi:Alcohol dehydrogenase, class IV [Plasmopara halstedii]|uniref:Alcohol dehydrogenase, class IV n=1 Tax=Plasmopara halstedii TaxID=4781 RepID=A0A0P1ALT3_PLAHL|nr:Alcohol dehydrogenase, class IV [Plasmopara halstedii]CEG41588.1 Alcohol dehydrogenase, class IV [Plasmopara halstedii]|eukprot:XP_024577957.1 Alcohol dehydrogenase, class IV [Plasmopara halstedii]
MSLFYLRSRRHLFRHVRCISSSLETHLQDLNASGQIGRVIFGANVASAQLGAISRAVGISKVLLVRDRDAGATSRTRFAEFLLMQAGVPCFQYTLKRDCATLEDVDHAAATAQRVGANGIVAFGGGNTMDVARAVALVLAAGSKATDYVDVAKEVESLKGKIDNLPVILVPTIAGSGAEVAHYSVLLDEHADTKVLFAPELPSVPEAILIDPTLMVTVPLERTVQGALTSLGQCLESFLLGCGEDAMEEMAMAGFAAIAEAFALALKEDKVELKNASLRESFAFGSLVSGIAANSSGTGATQALAIAVGGISEIPHAQVASALLPFVFDRYSELVSENEGDPFFDELRKKLERADDQLAALSGFQGVSVAEWIRNVIIRFKLPTVSTLNLEENLLNGLVDRAVQYQDETMERFRSDDNGAIFEKDDFSAILGAAMTS